MEHVNDSCSKLFGRSHRLWGMGQVQLIHHEPLASGSPGRLNLVKPQKNLMVMRQPAEPLEKLRLRHTMPTRPLDRLHDNPHHLSRKPPERFLHRLEGCHRPRTLLHRRFIHIHCRKR